MGFRFRKSVKLIPGVRLNIGKTGVSASIGGKGGSINVGKRGVRGTVGIPGTGISYSENLTPGDDRQGALPQATDRGPLQSASSRNPLFGVLILAILGISVFSCAGH